MASPIGEGRGRGGALLPDVLRACRQRRRREKIVDTTGAKLTGGELLTRALVLRQLLRRHVLAPDETMVGLLLPPSAAAVAANLGLALDRRVTVNLNYTLTSEQLNGSIAEAGIRHVLTSRKFLEKVPLELDAELVFLEDFRDKATRRDKLVGAFLGYVAPIGLLERLLGLDQIDGDDVMTVIFTSGTTDRPKGVLLTYTNLAASIEAVDSVVHWSDDDVLIGVLPFFHSFGSTIALWSMLVKDIKVAYHSNPLDAQIVGQLCRKHGGTILPVTPMFLRNYVRRCDPADFETLDIVATGGEKLPREVADAFEQKFGIRPFEAYGVTEMAPLISSNAPLHRAASTAGDTWREGTVGRPVAGVRAKVIDAETGAELGPGERGLLLVTGPNLMKGYLNQPEATAAVMRDGWYVTGDMAVIDEDGFITLVDRLSRFAKIAGEMVPFVAVETALAEIVGPDAEGGPRAVVTAVPDPTRGERLMVVHTPWEHTPEALRRELATAGLPNLFLPARDSFVEVEQLPVVGSGKIDLKRIKEIALATSKAEVRAAS
jgi:acyl-[acyl-carrier-protein]-phospholipid O-acyltransferase/long-chain-fatty-acid--[acyl-carrier-protein] ligase